MIWIGNKKRGFCEFGGQDLFSCEYEVTPAIGAFWDDHTKVAIQTHAACTPFTTAFNQLVVFVAYDAMQRCPQGQRWYIIYFVMLHFRE